MQKKLNVGILGATGLVGQRFVTLLENHPYFEVTALAASKRSADKTYVDAVDGRWKMNRPIPEYIKDFVVRDIYDIDEIASKVDFVFCAVNMKKDEIKKIEETYAKHEIPVVSNNSANRFTDDVPVVIPEINPEHFNIIPEQKKRLGTKKGFIVAKPNCSIQSYVPAVSALLKFKPTKILACTYQAISGSGKTFKEMPEIIDNVIPFIPGEEQKSEQEPLKVWGHIEGTKIVCTESPVITSQCLRVPVADGHMAAVFVSFDKKPSKEEILEAFKEYKGKPQLLDLPAAPKQFLNYFEDDFRPQPKLDRDMEKGMGIGIGRLREDTLFDYKFVCLSHNALRGAAGGALLTAELLYKEGYLY